MLPASGLPNLIFVVFANLVSRPLVQCYSLSISWHSLVHLDGAGMSTSAPKQLTELLIAWSHGDRASLDQLMPVVYAELHRLANRFFRRERPGHTLQAMALVHEAYFRLIDQTKVSWQNRAHCFCGGGSADEAHPG